MATQVPVSPPVTERGRRPTHYGVRAVNPSSRPRRVDD